MAKAPEKPEAKPATAPGQQSVTVGTALGTSTGTTALTCASVNGKVVIGANITGAGVPAGTTIVSQTSGTPGGNGIYVTSRNTTLAGIPITFTAGDTLSNFPNFTPIVPPPLIGQGGGAPPNFPPPTPPPIGAIPPGVLVGPVVAAAAVPPSTAGFPLIQYGTGNATTPPANGYFTKFTTTFPIPTIVFSNVYTGGKPPVTPPSTASTLCIVLNGWGPNSPPNMPTSPGSDGRLPRSLTGLMAMDDNGNGKKRKKAA